MKRLINILLWVGVLLLIIYRFHARIVAVILRLPQPSRRAAVTYDLRIPMRDGVTLATDHYRPIAGGEYPTVLIRSPYGRNHTHGGFGLLMGFIAWRFAERGYHVLLQDTRGRFDSEGTFNPYFSEKDDGLATLDWIARQPWYNGAVALWGASYLGIVQWVIADSPHVKALVPTVTGSQLHNILYPDGVFDLGLALRWLAIFQALDRARHHSLLAAGRVLWQAEQAIIPAFSYLPLNDADRIALGEPVDYYRMWLEHPAPDDPLWVATNQPVQMQQVNAPVHLIGGWYDFFLRALLEDYAALRAAGKQPYLTVGPWHHFDVVARFPDLREGLAWFDAALKGDRRRLRRYPVRIFVMGANEWREMEHWPPPTQEARYYLHSGSHLRTRPCLNGVSADSYSYDPANPTPILGGAQFSPWAGPKDNRRLELRRDVLSYTTPILEESVAVLGHVRFEAYVSSSQPCADFFGRLCDVYPDGRVINICDGLYRIEPGKSDLQADGSLRIEIDLWSTAYCFRAGHRIRLLVASGAHPHWSRNLGSRDPHCSTDFRAAEQTVFHDETHPSALVLPISRQ